MQSSQRVEKISDILRSKAPKLRRRVSGLAGMALVKRNSGVWGDRKVGSRLWDRVPRRPYLTLQTAPPG
jgi:hypothetical protein